MLSSNVDPSNSTQSVTDEIALSVFRQTWKDFYNWEPSYCRRAIDSLRGISNGPRTRKLPSDIKAFIEDDQLINNALHGGRILTVSTDDDDFLAVETYSEDGKISKTTHVPVQTASISSLPELKPYSAYEGCTPISRNIFLGDDSDHLPFIPFADDPGFDWAENAEFFTYLAWESRFFDPDQDLIILEAASRLQRAWSITLEQMDRMTVFPRSLLIQPEVSPGLIHQGLQRDFVRWPFGPPTILENAEKRSVPDVDDLYGRVKSATAVFCPNPSCIEYMCLTHVEATHLRAPSAVPRSQEQLLQKVTTPCGIACFSHETWHEGNVEWEESERNELRDLLLLDIKFTPCDLAVLIRKPCREVYAMRPDLLPRTPSRSPTPSINKQELSVYNRPGMPCIHTGPCTRASCPCIRSQSHCQRNCHCPSSCSQRWKGCKCSTVGSKLCRTNRCPCYCANRECDPKLCTRCMSRDCQNCGIQRAVQRSLEVRESEHGLGLFTTEPVKEDEFVLEYVGEIIYGSTIDSRDALARHRKRNYVFGLDTTFAIDATSAGNISRYINHADDANCYSRLRQVNDENRIGIFAIRDIGPGEEILIDYGNQFFHADEVIP